MKTVKERDDLNLLELSHQLHARTIFSNEKAQHDAYVEARTEVERRMKHNKDKLDEAKALLKYFCDRVEDGTIKSIITYGKFKEFLKSEK